MAAEKKRAVVGLVTMVVVVGAIMGLIHGYRVFFGARINERCTEHLGCLPGGVCISQRCQKRCAHDEDCPAAWGCRGTAVVVTRQRTLAHDEETDSTEKICFPPERLSRPYDPIMKEHEVRVAVIAQTLDLPGKSPVKVDDAAFDAAWEQLPLTERTNGTAGALADRIIQLVAARPR